MALVEHLEKLRHFHKIAQHRSINETATATGLSQAGLSKSLSALEVALDVQLFIRGIHGLTLTKEGLLTLEATKKIVQEANLLEVNLKSFKAAKIPEKFRVGMYDSIAVYLFSELNFYLREAYPNLKVELVVDASTKLAAAIASNQLDFAIAANLFLGEMPNVKFILLFEDKYSFYVSSKLDKRHEDLPLIIHPLAKDINGITIEETLDSEIKKRGCHRAFNFETIKILTAQGVGTGVLPTRVANPLVMQKQIVSTQIPKLKRFFGLHEIGFATSNSFLQKHKEFVNDISRLGHRWSKH